MSIVMKKIEVFLMNLGSSLLSYVVIIVFSFFLNMTLYLVPPARNSVIVSGILALFITLIFAALFFWLGTILNSLGKHWLNYLSVFGTFVIALPLALQSTFVASFLPLPFPVLWFLPVGLHGFHSVGFLIIVTLLPSIFIWLGMVWQSRKLEKKQAEETDESAS